jgi:hypothetical protein
MKSDTINKLIAFFKTRNKELLDNPNKLKEEFISTYGINYQLEISIFCKICSVCLQKNITDLDKDYIIYIGKLIFSEININEKVAVVFLGCYAYIKQYIPVETLKELINYKQIENINVGKNIEHSNDYHVIENDEISEEEDYSFSDTAKYLSGKVSKVKDNIISIINSQSKETTKPGKLRIIARIGLLMVVIGFFMPISCNKNGFDIASEFLFIGKYSTLSTIWGYAAYLCFFSACFGVVLLIINLFGIKTSLRLDWLAYDFSVISGLAVYVDYWLGHLTVNVLSKLFNNQSNMQYGAYVIAIGWIITFIFLHIATSNELKNLDILKLSQKKHEKYEKELKSYLKTGYFEIFVLVVFLLS